MKNTIIVIMLVSVMLCSCATETTISLPETIPTETDIPAESILETTTPSLLETVPSEDPDLLPVESGAYLSKYVNSEFGAFLEYYTFIPENAVKNMPLVIFLHGDGEIGRIDALKNIALVDNAIEYYGDSYPFIAIAPCRLQKSWCTGVLPQTVLSLIDETIAKYDIDPEKVIITGFSSGAMGTWYLISNHSEYFSAAVPISCPNEYPILYDNIKNVPIWGFVGEKEVFYTQKMSEIINWTAEIGGDARLTVIEDMAHPGMDKAAFSQEVIQWMLDQ